MRQILDEYDYSTRSKNIEELDKKETKSWLGRKNFLIDLQICPRALMHAVTFFMIIILSLISIWHPKYIFLLWKDDLNFQHIFLAVSFFLDLK